MHDVEKGLLNERHEMLSCLWPLGKISVSRHAQLTTHLGDGKGRTPIWVGDARQKMQIRPLEETHMGVAEE